MGTTVTSTGITFNDATTQSTAAVSFPAGTLMLFQQTAAPTGWTKQTTHDNKALRVVSGTASSGGTSAFTTVFANQTPTITVGATTLSIAQMPSHNHSFTTYGVADTAGGTIANSYGSFSPAGFSVSSTGGGGSHTHSGSSSAITLNVQYVDLIIASKN